MAASFTIAARNNGFPKAGSRAATQASVAAYREAMATFADMGTLAIWYAHLSEDELLRAVRSAAAKMSKSKKEAERHEKRALKVREKARTRDSVQALSKLGEAWTDAIGSSASHRSWSRPETWRPPTARRQRRWNGTSTSSDWIALAASPSSPKPLAPAPYQRPGDSPWPDRYASWSVASSRV